jgi:hypothetical protein
MVCCAVYLRPGLETNGLIEIGCLLAERPQGQYAKTGPCRLDDPCDKLFANPLISPGGQYINMPYSANIALRRVRISVEPTNANQLLLAIDAKQGFSWPLKPVDARDVFRNQPINELKPLFPAFHQQGLEIMQR